MIIIWLPRNIVRSNTSRFCTKEIRRIGFYARIACYVPGSVEFVERGRRRLRCIYIYIYRIDACEAEENAREKLLSPPPNENL